ncbi:MAG: hypothetical protein LUD50_01110 [Clostridia bacterium]|nr:hypothetical protein [Clostridia bacterium]
MNIKIKTTLILALVFAAIAALAVAGYMYLSHAGTAADSGVLYASADEALCDHVYEDTTVAPTCTTQGYTEHTCTLCGDTYQDNYTDATGHSYVSCDIPATCTSNGYTIHTCMYCNSTYTDNVTDALGHYYTDTVYTPTCTERGYTLHTCLTCGESYKDTYEDALGHDYAATVTEATCLEGGYTTYTCTVCGDTYLADEIAPLDHDYTITVKEATCTSYGYTKNECSRCGISYVTDYVSPLGHTYEVQEVIPATEEAVGYTIYRCSTCGDVMLSDFCDSGEDGYVHNMEYEIVEPTCTEYGYISFWCTDEDCGYAYEIINAAPAGHTEKTYYVPATCEEAACMKTICSVCGEILSTEEVAPATGHTYEGVITAPGCLEGGYTTYTCSVCGDSYVTDYTNPKGHIYSLVTTASRSSKTISASYTCTGCGDDATDSLMVSFTGTSGTVYTRYFTDGSMSYAALPGDTYTVRVYDISGEESVLVGIFPITMSTEESNDLLIDGNVQTATPTESTKTVLNPVSSTEEIHNLSIFIQNDDEACILYITAVCSSCGESLASELTVRATFADGTMLNLSADKYGALNYSGLASGTEITVLSEDGDTALYDFIIGDTEGASTGTGMSGSTTSGDTGTGTNGGSSNSGTGTDGTGTAGDGSGTDGSGTDGTAGDGTDTDAETGTKSGSGKAVACIIIAIIIIALLAFVILKVMKSRKAKKAAEAEKGGDSEEDAADDTDNTENTDKGEK